MSRTSRCPGRFSSLWSAVRRGAILGIALLAWAGVVGAATTSSPRGSGTGLVMCTGKYALCDAAACTPIPAQGKLPGSKVTTPTHALCECVVEEGKNLGPGPCANRVPSGKNGEYILSTYSFALPDKLYLSCPAGGERTVCFGYPCLIDEKHPERAHCTCPIHYNSPAFETQGGDCNVAACKDGLWQGGTPQDYALLNPIFAKATGEKPPAACGAGAQPKK